MIILSRPRLVYSVHCMVVVFTKLAKHLLSFEMEGDEVLLSLILYARAFCTAVAFVDHSTEPMFSVQTWMFETEKRSFLLKAL